MKRRYQFLLALILFVNVCFSFTAKVAYSQTGWEKEVELGIPTDNNSSDDILIKRDQYVLSYNVDMNIANWVSWDLNKDWFGDAERQTTFKTDPDLPHGAYKVKTSDYVNSGYDRGHMTRSECRTRSTEDNKATFYLSNILPQTPKLNQRLWKNLEDYCNDLCNVDNKQLYIICGGVYYTNHKIKNKISIPDSCYKIVVILNHGQGLSDVTENTPVIAVMMPNKKRITDFEWMDYLTTVDALEASTGYDFLSNVPVSIQKKIESNTFH